MEPITHFLTGACLGRAGFNRKTAYAVLAGALAAEAADLDMLWEFAGPVKEFQHHRGITHTFLGAPFMAGAVVGAVALLHLWRQSRRKHTDSDVGVNWGWLYAVALIAALSHIFLDWTNNYGVRPLFPFNAHWYAGSFMFIFEPVLYGLFIVAFVMPWVTGLADREIGVRRMPFRGRGWAIFALAGMLLLDCWRWAEHAHALAILGNTQVASEPVERMAAEPYPVNPFRWHAIVETADSYQTAEINTRTGSIESDPHRDVIYKPADTAAGEAAKRTLLGRVYLDWGTWAIVRDLGQVALPALDPPNLPPGRTWTTVEFTDLRFDYEFLAGRTPSGNPPLTGWVYIVDDRDDGGEVMDGRVQK